MSERDREKLIQVILRGGSAAEVEAAYGAERSLAESDRRSIFTKLGAPTTSSAPAACVYHEQSKITPSYWPTMTTAEAVDHTLALDYRRYPKAERVKLAKSPLELTAPIGPLLRERRSVRRFGEQPVALAELSQLLEVACGVTATIDAVPRRSYPSGGALYPVEVYPLIVSVSDVRPGIYHYATLAHELERLGPLAGYDELHHAAPQLVREAHPALMIVLTLVLERSAAKYLERGYRFGLLEAGHIAQNIVLVASAQGLGTVCLGGFFDDDMNSLLRLNVEEENAVYGVLVGRRPSPAI
ncbi:MAG: SagB/ThcOx family dehydrogenase [Deltaproteobacteria bacterium]|nr:SagB/ThcOx family dehydrogenase [Deltaproteobacteria bacterium]